MKFRELGLSEDLLKAIEEKGFKEATPIQAETIPLTLKGKDVIGQAQTGTGKTAAFGLPIIENIDLDNPNVQALIISPTRELAIQTQGEIKKFGKFKGIDVAAVYGGSDIRRQISTLKRHPRVVVGTPGRLLDHINRRTLKLGHVKTLVLDEADDMLDMGFLDDIESIIKQVPEERQTLLFSATMPQPIKRVGVQFMKDPQQITIKAKAVTTDLIDQYYIKVKQFEKFDVMTRFFDIQAPKVTIVFCRTKRRVDEVAKGLLLRGYSAAGLHGDLTQNRRSQILREFKNEKIDVLVATDVAARGIDVSGVTHVYNYDIPQDSESYVHRIGRTGRAGNHGVSMTFVEPNEMSYLRDVEKLTKVRMMPLKPPSADEALSGQLSVASKEISSMLKKLSVDKFSKTADELLEQYDAKDLVALLLSKMTRNQVKVHITPERPLPNRKGGHNKFGGRNKRRGGFKKRYGNGGNRHHNDRHSRNNNDSHHSNNHRSNKSNNSKRPNKSFTIKHKD
ncbi:DEAD/DEAH box helicase [Apilactobacillus xinyiensis]|uniref:DEAD-box ATP-dependent RNA helicase CshA n=1 Tax=Apilactobacillus xinyiensis TaxID=2841032 RepID=A0ABT0I367_9LACO|nr:DEAD/DEAH box helicase [Apilactobacillus xinyiensis]MCK8625132.1 DEAD/DEAH box helicase [Apilactobacillus xinyiensis]MCL0312873.1 DEAD/DEAH box helicase [Apilactobacillus xinyiensis]MCL0319269.1 DEAD/DEAH box helicase [Apilactobacillus xinyiensis]